MLGDLVYCKGDDTPKVVVDAVTSDSEYEDEDANNLDDYSHSDDISNAVHTEEKFTFVKVRDPLFGILLH